MAEYQIMSKSEVHNTFRRIEIWNRFHFFEVSNFSRSSLSL